MEIPVLRTLTECNLQGGRMQVLLSGTNFTNQQRNQLQRITKTLKRKGLELDTTTRPCLADSISILMVDKRNQLRGTYKLEQADINRMFVELDILMINDSYGEGVSR